MLGDCTESASPFFVKAHHSIRCQACIERFQQPDTGFLKCLAHLASSCRIDHTQSSQQLARYWKWR
jgi:hypothetical protein